MAATDAADTRLFLRHLLAYVDLFRLPPDAARQARVARQQKAWRAGMALHLAGVADAQPLHFGRVSLELAKRLDKDAIVTTGVGNHNIWARELLATRDRESFVQEASWGTMGGELGAGIAAKLVYPERQVVVVTGDGSLLMGAADLVTAVEAGTNILVVVLNDSRYGIITAMQRRDYERSFGDEIGAIDFVRLAESFGATGIRVATPEALPEAVGRAVELTAQSPVILDAVCDHRYCWPDRAAILAAGMEAIGPSKP